MQTHYFYPTERHRPVLIEISGAMISTIPKREQDPSMFIQNILDLDASQSHCYQTLSDSTWNTGFRSQ